MRKGALLLSILLAASFTTVADAAKRKKAAPAPTPAYTNAQSSALVTDGLTNFLTLGQASKAAQPAPKKMAMKKAKKKKM